MPPSRDLHDLAGFCLYDPAFQQLRAHALNFPSNQAFVEPGNPISLEETSEGRAFTSRQTVLIKSLSLTEFPAAIVKRGTAESLRSGCAVPLISHGRALGTLSIVSLCEGVFTEHDADFSQPPVQDAETRNLSFPVAPTFRQAPRYRRPDLIASLVCPMSPSWTIPCASAT